MNGREYVLRLHANARAVFDADRGTFKIYFARGDNRRPDQLAWIALSASFETEAEAWRDAAEAVERRMHAAQS